mmetsp:Transcript_48260/g.121472  ORF Transcript_48260/g.121472 Transcript_48260/m.121472 type:complete len:367 (+) Transcript_48260:434-1534(+)
MRDGRRGEDGALLQQQLEQEGRQKNEAGDRHGGGRLKQRQARSLRESALRIDDFLTVACAVLTDVVEVAVASALKVGKADSLEFGGTEVADRLTSNPASADGEPVIVATLKGLVTSEATESCVTLRGDATEVIRQPVLVIHGVELLARLLVQTSPVDHISTLRRDLIGGKTIPRSGSLGNKSIVLDPDRVVNNTRAELQLVGNIASLHPTLVPGQFVGSVSSVDGDVISERCEGMGCTRWHLDVAEDVVRRRETVGDLPVRGGVVVCITPDGLLPLRLLLALVVTYIDPHALGTTINNESEAHTTDTACGGLVVVVIPVVAGEFTRLDIAIVVEPQLGPVTLLLYIEGIVNESVLPSLDRVDPIGL